MEERLALFSDAVSSAFQQFLKGPIAPKLSGDKANFVHWVQAEQPVVSLTAAVTSSALSPGAISTLAIAPSSAILQSQSAQAAIPSTSVQQVQTFEDPEDHSQIFWIKPEIDRIEPARSLRRRIPQQRVPLSPRAVVFEEVSYHLLAPIPEVQVQSVAPLLIPSNLFVASPKSVQIRPLHY